MTSRTLARLGALAGTGALVALLGALPASAHVVADPDTATAGGYGVITLRVPDESPTAGTVRLQVTLPTDRPITSVRTEPMPGWTAQVQEVPLPAPVPIGEGETATTAVSGVTWTADPGVRIAPGQFAQFRMSAGPLPDAPGQQLVMPATQTYDDGQVVAWADAPPAPGTAEPEHPAPVLTLVADTGDAAAGAPTSGASDDTARWLGGAGLVLGAVGAALGLVAVLRRRPGGPTGSAGTSPSDPSSPTNPSTTPDRTESTV